jgi:hypothetical protein
MRSRQICKSLQNLQLIGVISRRYPDIHPFGIRRFSIEVLLIELIAVLVANRIAVLYHFIMRPGKTTNRLRGLINFERVVFGPPPFDVICIAIDIMHDTLRKPWN